MTEQQINHETTKIRRGGLTLNEYIRLSRVGENFKMSRAQKREVYGIHLAQRDDVDSKRAARLKNRLTPQGAAAYNAITKYRDETMLETA